MTIERLAGFSRARRSASLHLLGVIAWLALPAAQAQTNAPRDGGAYVLLEKGASLGAWTSDLDAARALAKTRGLPLLLDFTGSDWCPACMHVHDIVLTEPEWVAYASNRFVMVVIDFPRNTPQPPGRRARNEALGQAYGVEALPTFMLFAPDGTNRISQFQLQQGVTPYSFMRDVNEALLDWPAHVDRLVASLPPAQAEAYRKALAEFQAIKKEVADWQATRPKVTPENQKRFDKYQSRILLAGTELSALGRERTLGQLNPEGAARQKASLARTDAALERYEKLRVARRTLEDWTLAAPEDTADNRQTLRRLLGKIETLEAEIAAAK